MIKKLCILIIIFISYTFLASAAHFQLDNKNLINHSPNKYGSKLSTQIRNHKIRHKKAHKKNKVLDVENVPEELEGLLDMSCLAQGILNPPKIRNGKFVRYSKRRSLHHKNELEKLERTFLVASFQCDEGYKFQQDNSGNLYCSKGKWIGDNPICQKHGLKTTQGDRPLRKCPLEFLKNCQHDCIINHNEPMCTCHKGFILKDNKCQDMNEQDDEHREDYNEYDEYKDEDEEEEDDEDDVDDYNEEDYKEEDYNVNTETTTESNLETHPTTALPEEKALFTEKPTMTNYNDESTTPSYSNRQSNIPKKTKEAELPEENYDDITEDYEDYKNIDDASFLTTTEAPHYTKENEDDYDEEDYGEEDYKNEDDEETTSTPFVVKEPYPPKEIEDDYNEEDYDEEDYTNENDKLSTVTTTTVAPTHPTTIRDYNYNEEDFTEEDYKDQDKTLSTTTTIASPTTEYDYNDEDYEEENKLTTTTAVASTYHNLENEEDYDSTTIATTLPEDEDTLVSSTTLADNKDGNKHTTDYYEEETDGHTTESSEKRKYNNKEGAIITNVANNENEIKKEMDENHIETILPPSTTTVSSGMESTTIDNDLDSYDYDDEDYNEEDYNEEDHHEEEEKNEPFSPNTTPPYHIIPEDDFDSNNDDYDEYEDKVQTTVPTLPRETTPDDKINNLTTVLYDSTLPFEENPRQENDYLGTTISSMLEKSTHSDKNPTEIDVELRIRFTTEQNYGDTLTTSSSIDNTLTTTEPYGEISHATFSNAENNKNKTTIVSLPHERNHINKEHNYNGIMYIDATPPDGTEDTTFRPVTPYNNQEEIVPFHQNEYGSGSGSDSHNIDDEDGDEDQFSGHKELDEETITTIRPPVYENHSNNGFAFIPEECQTGFTLGKNGICIDINECKDEKTPKCSEICENTVGSYHCLCPLGHELSYDLHSCQDINECSNQPCSHYCINDIGSFHCECPEHLHLFNNTTCVEINCSHQHIKKENQIECLCPIGFRLGENNLTCEDVNECLKSENNNCSQICENRMGSYECGCRKGFALKGDQISCDDVNECADKYLNDCSDICVNNAGGYECLCNSGFELDEDGLNCKDINECLENNGYCSHICFNTPGSFSCECPEYYNLVNDGKTCRLIDPCLSNNGGCSHYCQNIEGVSTCHCPSTHVLSNQTHCEDMNPCSKNNGGCSHVCTHLENGLAECSCPNDYILIDDKKCEKLDPCIINNGGCSHGCSYINNTVECSCPNGLTLNKENHCEIIDPCSIHNGGCSQICTNINGFPQCSCHPGYKLKNNTLCKRTDFCQTNNGGCSHICRNIAGRSKCFCPPDFELFNKTACKKINPCHINNGGCSHICLTVDFEVKCDCPNGHELNNNNNKTCLITNPCHINNGGCSHECVAENQKVICFCPEGHQLEGKKCVMKDPCMFKNGGCSHTCVNVYGEAFCKCPIGFELINRSCFKSHPCLISNGGCSHNCSMFKGEAKCSCPNGLKLEDKTCVSVDDNVCSVTNNNAGCSHFCKSVGGVAVCSCPSGYLIRPNKRDCKELNECRKNNGGCSHGCTNLIGSYMCLCPNGYVLAANRRTCVNTVDRCGENNGNCEHVCRNYAGGIKCGCREGFILQQDGRSCKSVDFGDCAMFQPPYNGKVKCLQMNPKDVEFAPVGTQCIVWCENGYKLRGESLRICESSGNWGGTEPYCAAVACPRLRRVERGQFVPSTCMTGKTFPGEECKLNCMQGFKPAAELENLKCLPSLKWNIHVSNEQLWNGCVREYPETFIRCPNGGFLTFTLPQRQKSMLVVIPRPESNVDWFKYVSSQPSWGMQLSNTLSPGRTDLVFSAASPNTNSTVSCRLTINVLDKEAPNVTRCPNDLAHKLKKNQYNHVVHWTEPEFIDNIGVVGIYKSKEPGSRFGVGLHEVNYIAHDAAGNKAECRFTININKDEDSVENPIGKYRAILICPHGIQYVSQSQEQLDNTINQEGCHWSHIRVKNNKKVVHPHGYKYNGHHKSPENLTANKRHAFYWYNRCC